MQIAIYILVAAVVFSLCYLVDKGFTKIFRSQAEHQSGKAVRLNKRYGSFGLILAVLGIAAVFMGLSGDWVLVVGGGIVIVMGLCLVVYYMSFGIFYDTDTFILTTIKGGSRTYHYRDIQAQQLYNNQGHLLIELYLSDGRVAQVQGTMPGAYDFMDHAFAAWCRQTGKTQADCPHYDPANSCWFPPVEG